MIVRLTSIMPKLAPVEMPAEPTQAALRQCVPAQHGALGEDDVELIADLLTTGGEARPTDIARRAGRGGRTGRRGD